MPDTLNGRFSDDTVFRKEVGAVLRALLDQIDEIEVGEIIYETE